MVLLIMILTISLIILLLINVITCLYINLTLLSLIILYNTVYHYVYDSNKINKYYMLIIIVYIIIMAPHDGVFKQIMLFNSLTHTNNVNTFTLQYT